MTKGLRILLIICILAAGLTLIAHAQTPIPQPLNVTTAPDVFDISANPGDTVDKTFRIRNNNTTATTLKVSLEKIIPDTNGNLILQNFKSTDDYAKWLTVSQATISASPREWIDVPFTISIPKTASFGYYWAILVSNEAGASQNGATTHISGAVAIPVLLTVESPGMKFDAKLLDFKTSSSWYEYLPTTFLTTIQNNGNVHIRPAGTIFVRDMFGNTVAQLSFNKDAGSILPSAKRIFQTAWNDSFITYDPKMEDGNILVDSKGKPEMQVNIHFDKLLSLRIGKYTATELVVVSGLKKDLSFEQTTTFFVFPWKIILGLLLVVVLAGVGLLNTIATVIRRIKKFFTKE